MPEVDGEAPLLFLRTAFQPADWVAIFLKQYGTGRVTQRVEPLSCVTHPTFQAWLHSMNTRTFNVYVSVNAIVPGRHSRARDAIGGIRHVFLDADHDGFAVLRAVAARQDLPAPSYVLSSSSNRVHVLWRVAGFEPAQAEALQKMLARQLGTDPAATPVTQMTRLPGFVNHKRAVPHLVTVDYHDAERVLMPEAFPAIAAVDTPPSVDSPTRHHLPDREVPVLERARCYLTQVPPAVSGQHGDVHTFRVCCRIVRGFALDEDQAMAALRDWNARCQPPWRESELRDKVRRARRYGREAVGGLL